MDDRQKLGKILFDFIETLYEGDGSFRFEKFQKKVLKPLGYKTFVDCRPYGFMGLKDTINKVEVEDCYLD